MAIVLLCCIAALRCTKTEVTILAPEWLISGAYFSIIIGHKLCWRVWNSFIDTLITNGNIRRLGKTKQATAGFLWSSNTSNCDRLRSAIVKCKMQHYAPHGGMRSNPVWKMCSFDSQTKKTTYSYEEEFLLTSNNLLFQIIMKTASTHSISLRKHRLLTSLSSSPHKRTKRVIIIIASF